MCVCVCAYMCDQQNSNLLHTSTTIHTIVDKAHESGCGLRGCRGNLLLADNVDGECVCRTGKIATREGGKEGGREGEREGGGKGGEKGGEGGREGERKDSLVPRPHPPCAEGKRVCDIRATSWANKMAAQRNVNAPIRLQNSGDVT